jgi:predicted nucleic acid-binding protein
MRILLDTNILLRSVEPGHAQHQATVDAVDGLRRSGHELVIVPQVLYEFWSVATRPIDQNGLGMSPGEAQAELVVIQRLFRLLRDERAVYAIWERLVSSLGVVGKQAHDARLAAAMQRHALSHLLTFNTTDFARYAFVTAISPLDVASGAKPVRR